MSGRGEQEETLIENKWKQVEDTNNNLLMNPNKLSFRVTKLRWLCLFLACMAMFGSYYCFDNPQGLQSGLQDKKWLGLTDIQYNSLYSVYSFPNIILPLVGGMIVDRMGCRVGTFVFTLILIIGQLVFMLGCTYQSFWVLIAGRFIFGLGGECLCVCQSVVISQWFKDKELALALGLNITISRLGSSINSALTPYIFEHQVNSGSSHPFFLPTFIGLIACILSWVAGLGMCYMDKESDRREGKLDDIIEKDESEQINLKDIFKFDIKLWILVVTCTLIYGSFFAFNGNANDILHNMYNIPTGIAGVYLLVIYLSASIVTPMFGLVVDKYGRRVLLMILSITLFLIALVVFCIIPSDCNQIIPLIPLILIGLFYATYAAIFWPCIPLVVDQNKQGTAFGVVNSIQNINLAVSPLVFGVIKNATKDQSNSKNGYLFAFMFLFAQNIIAMILTFVLYFLDIRGDKSLNMVTVKTKGSRRQIKSSIAKR